MSSPFDSLAHQVAASNSVRHSATTLLNGLATQLSAAIALRSTDNGAALQNFAAALTHQSAALAEALTANTPAGVQIPNAPSNPPNTPLTPTGYNDNPPLPGVSPIPATSPLPASVVSNVPNEGQNSIAGQNAGISNPQGQQGTQQGTNQQSGGPGRVGY
jgi:hypothetical protein